MQSPRFFSNIYNRVKNTFSSKQMAAVDMWTMCYNSLSDKDSERAIPYATVTDLHTGEQWVSGKDGYIKTNLEVGRKLSLMFNASAEYPDTQTATVTVPKEGLTGRDNEITFQVPSDWLYHVLKKSFGEYKEGHCHVVTTVQEYGKNMHDDDGLAGAKAKLISEKDNKVLDTDMYLGQIGKYTEWFRPLIANGISSLSKAFNDKKLIKPVRTIVDKISEFGEDLKCKSTSHDGAAIFFNVPQGEYKLVAEKQGVEFTSSRIEVLPNSPVLINVSPPQSPREIKKSYFSNKA